MLHNGTGTGDCAHYHVHTHAARDLCAIKRAFRESYRGGAHIQEAVPVGRREYPGDMSYVIRFAEADPIYQNSYETHISGARCVVYEGDINQYWLDSVKNPGSAQPFYPTWLASAHILASAVRESGCRQMIDVGSGDGRIAFCGSVLGMDACSIELDRSLADLQREVFGVLGASVDVRCADAADFDYSSLGFGRAAVFIGGLPQLGDVLAHRVLERIRDAGMSRCQVVLAGSRPRNPRGPSPERHGWGPAVDRFKLERVWEMSLPTVWTFDQLHDTPYACYSMG